MKFKNTKKYLLDIASLRLDCKVGEINRERKEVSSREYYWEHGKKKKQNPKYSKLSNEEIYSKNAPLIGQIRGGKINKKNQAFILRYGVSLTLSPSLNRLKKKKIHLCFCMYQ